MIKLSLKRKRKSKGKRKGKGFEWEIARKISLNLSNGEDDFLLMPSNASGAQFTNRQKSGKKADYQSSDLTHNSPKGEPFVRYINCELKSGYQRKRKGKDGTITKTNWSILDILDGTEEKPIFLEFWEQCKRDSDLTNREPVLIFRRNNRQACIVIQEGLFSDFILYTDLKNDIAHIQLFLGNDLNLIIMSFDDFLNWCKVKDLVNMLKETNREKEKNQID